MYRISAKKIIPLSLSFLLACNNIDSTGKETLNKVNTAAPLINYALVNTYPHDTTSYTEGLLIHEGKLYESTGSPENMPQTRSLFGVVDLLTGNIKKEVEIDGKKYFGEGISFLNGRVYQLTYKNKVGFIYDAKTFHQTGEFSIPATEGWGMTTDGLHLIMSDGTSKLTWLDPSDLKPIKTINVSDEKGTVTKINELEFINNFVYANIYETNSIIKIDPSTGIVKGRLDLSSLANEAKSRHPGSLEMNGIAYDSVSHTTFITGKMWPIIYEIQFAW